MIASNSEINFYTDTIIVQTVLSNNKLSKTAGIEEMASELIGKVKNYFGSKVESDNKAGSILNMLAPGALSLTLSAMGMPWIGLLFGVAMNVFHIDVAGILGSIWNSLKGILSGDKKTTSAEVDGIVQGAVQAHTTPATQSEAEGAADHPVIKTQSQFLRDARMVKLAMIEFERVELAKFGGIKEKAGEGILSIFSGQKLTVASILTRVLGWIFKIAIASVGLMVAGDLINKYVLDKPGETSSAPAEPVATSTQKKFPLQPTYKDIKRSGGWSVNISNNPSSIGNMLISFAKKVYQGLDGLDNIIEATAGFQVIRDKIVNYNQSSAGDATVDIPKNFFSEKHIVDFFIDEVAENTK